MRIRDKQLQAFTQELRDSGNPKIDDENVLKLLAGVADAFFTSSDRALQKLTRPGITRQEQLDIAQKGLSRKEREDVIQLLDHSGWEMTPGAKNFLEALVGRAPLIESFGPLTILGDQRDGIQGVARPGEIVEAINLSTAPEGRLHLVDTIELGTADEFGRFQGQLPDMKEGDVIRLRTRAADGSTSDWLTIQAKGLSAADTRNAVVNLERIDLLAADDGTVSATHNTERPLSEPGATLRFTNLRTGQTQDVKVTDKGSLPEGLKLEGQAGDEFSVAASDGKNNLDFSAVAGKLKVPGGGGGTVGLDDPAPLKDDTRDDGTPRFSKVRFTGPLFIDGPAAADVRQGAIGNCYFPAAVAAVAYTDPDVIREAIKDNGDGTYTVRFHQSDWYGTGAPVEVKVDGDLYARSWGGPVYGSSLGGSTQPDKMELWFPLIEKAYAQWKGGYEAIGNGGSSGRVMSELIGGRNTYDSVSEYNKDRIYEKIRRGQENGWPMTAGTYGKSEAARYTNTGVYANHAYSVLGVEEEGGVKYVKLRNPWGQSEPGWDGKNDGFFRLELDKFAQLYQNFQLVEK